MNKSLFSVIICLFVGDAIAKTGKLYIALRLIWSQHFYGRTILPELKGVLLTPSEGCGYTKVAHKKIVGGSTAKPGAWPWLALVLYTNETGTFSNCGKKIFLWNLLQIDDKQGFFYLKRWFFDYNQVQTINPTRHAKCITSSFAFFLILSCRHVLTAAHCYRKDL